MEQVGARSVRARVMRVEDPRILTGRGRYVDDAPAGEITLKRSSGLLFDLCPCGVRNRGQLAMEVIHFVLLSAILSQVKRPLQE